MKLLLFFLLTLIFTPAPAIAKTCKQKWAEYYAGKSWFKPWCDTESYKRRQADNERVENIYNDEPPEGWGLSKEAALARRLAFTDPRYRILENCDSVEETCLNIYARIKNSNKDTSIDNALLTCSIGVHLLGKTYDEKLYLYADLDSNGNELFGDLQPNESMDIKLHEGRVYHSYKYGSKYSGKKNVPYTLKLPIPKRLKFTLEYVDCTPLKAISL